LEWVDAEGLVVIGDEVMRTMVRREDNQGELTATSSTMFLGKWPG